MLSKDFARERDRDCDFERDFDRDFECDFFLCLIVRGERDLLRFCSLFSSLSSLRLLIFSSFRRSLVFSSVERWTSLVVAGVCDLLRDRLGEADLDHERRLLRELLCDRCDQPDEADERERRSVETSFLALPCDRDRDRPKN